jgi:DNA-binding response OmpR family regulator
MDKDKKMKKVIMIADDSSTVRKFVAFSLQMNQFEVVMAETVWTQWKKYPRTRSTLQSSI